MTTAMGHNLMVQKIEPYRGGSGTHRFRLDRPAPGELPRELLAVGAGEIGGAAES